MPTLEERLDAGIRAFRKERQAQTKKEIDGLRAKARKINEKARTVDDRRKARQSVVRAKARLAKAKKRKGKKGTLSIFDFLKS